MQDSGEEEELVKTKELPKSIRKFIRKEKARIRREVSGSKEQQQIIGELNLQFHKA